MKTRFLLLTTLLFLVCLVSASAVGTRLNLTMKEVVYNNITFAVNFDEVEDNPFCKIDGTLNVTNPEADTIYDIYLTFYNVNRMTTDFLWSTGKAGAMFSGGAGTIREYGEIGNNTNNLTLTQDLDNDNAPDYMWTNGTGVYINMSWDGLVFINLTDNLGNPISIENAGGAPVDVFMDQVAVNGTRLYGNLTIIGQAVDDNILAENMQITLNEYYVSPIVIHIPELRPGNFSTYTYNVTCTNTDPPVNIESDYQNTRHPTIDKKVLAGFNWTVTQWAINNFYLDLNVTNINITMTAQVVTWNSTSSDFQLEYLYGLGDYANVYGNGTSTSTWWWTPDGGQLDNGQSENITYIVSAPESVPFSAIYMAILENITYDAAFLMSNLSLYQVNASAQINMSFQKRISQPSTNLFDHNVTWEIRPAVSTPLNITFLLNKVTLWVTHDLNINNYTGLNQTIVGSPIQEINISTGWGGVSDYWYFNYTDGSNATYPPPIVWMKPEYLLSYGNQQILNFSNTVSGNDLYMKYIYVVNGYWLQIQKNITSLNEDQYRISTYVENIGNGWTPQYEKVTVYDFVPNNFNPYEWSIVPGLNQSVGTPGSEFYGTSFVWDIPWKSDLNSSLGPKYGPLATTWGNYSWNVTYLVNGTGEYKVTQLYIVGLDPLKVDGASGSPLISVITGLQSYSREIMYVGIVLFLVILNIANLIITHQINKKLDNAPAAPSPRIKR
jgi:hypothetical protein